MKNLKLIFSLWLPVLIWAGTLFYLSSIPSLKTSPNPFLDEILRSIAHFVFYFIGYFLFFRALNNQKKKKKKANFLLPLILVSLYGLSDEFHQSLVPTRTFQLQDLLIDFSGAFISKIILTKFLPKLHQASTR
tara:strand:- start:356 stop:754 length:399 start_codon:yes stop_codon:yes gene_type:complete